MGGTATASLEASREQILGFRLRVNHLLGRLPSGAASLQQAAGAGLQDSMPRSALLQLHARVSQVGPESWKDSALLQVWGPHHSVFVIAAPDLGVFTLGLLPASTKGRERAYSLADRLVQAIGWEPTPRREAAAKLGLHHPNQLRYAATTGRLVIRWEGAGEPLLRCVPPPDLDPLECRAELVRRYVHHYGPTTAAAFGAWSGIGTPAGAEAFHSLGPGLVAVATPIGEAWILASDEPLLRSCASPIDQADTSSGDGSSGPGQSSGSVRLLPSGDAYWLLSAAQRELLVPDAAQRDLLWTPRVWPGALVIDGQVAGTWRRAGHKLLLAPWRRLTPTERQAVAAEVASLPLGLDRPITLSWE